MKLSLKIKSLRQSMGLKQKELADKMPEPVDQSTIAKWEGDKQKPSPSNMFALAGLAGQTPQQFLGLAPVDSAMAGLRLVNVTGELQAGAWQEAVDWPEDEQYQVAAPLGKKWEPVPIHARVVRGNSMNLVYPDGSIVYIATIADLGRKPKSGERVAVQRIDESGLYECTLKEYRVHTDGKAWLMPRSDDPEFQQAIRYAERGRQVKIIGIVVASLIYES